MLFGSIIFVLLFLPVTLAVFHALRLQSRQMAAKVWVVLLSLVFYAWWDYRYVPLIAGSVIVNYGLSVVMGKCPARARAVTAVGIALNLALLGYYKYANFFVDTVNRAAGADIFLARIVLPLAISFFTFQQIAYLVESYRDRKAADSFVDYALFVLFFPHLIAGPITHHKEMLPQFASAGTGKLPRSYITVGAAIFVCGLAKKSVIADTIALVVDPLFDHVSDGGRLGTGDAWLAALGYTVQLYFDFSGYSDMAIGLGLMFGILLPVNFASPYRSTSIVEFWRRWHISLSRFLRNYVYIPLGGNRRGAARRRVNLMATMVVGGLWHGAGYTFLAWGALHGAYLTINHAWNTATGSRSLPGRGVLGWGLTMLAVVVGWVVFRAADLPAAMSILVSMIAPVSGTAVPMTGRALAWPVVLLFLAIAATAPNLLEMAGYPRSTPGPPIEHDGIREIRWPLSPLGTAALLGVVAAFAMARLPDPGVFLYFTF